MPKASVQRALNALAEAGWLRQEVGDPRWVVSARFALLAEAAPAVVAARESARPHLEELHEATGLSVALLVLDGDHMSIVAGLGGPEMLRAVESTLGPLPVHVSAAGRAILSRLPVATRREVLDRALRRYTERSLTEPEALLAEIARAEQQGYAAIQGEFQADVNVTAAPVLDRSGVPIAAVGLFGPQGRLAASRIAELGRSAIGCASAISAGLAEEPQAQRS